MHCRLHFAKPSLHLSQIFTGFGMLARARRVELSWVPSRPFGNDFVSERFLTCEVRGRRLVYDLHDYAQLDSDRLGDCDVYFKRSFDPAVVRAAKAGSRILPLGLNYACYGPADASLRRSFYSFLRARSRKRLAESIRDMARSSRLASSILQANDGRATCTSLALEADPVPASSPRAIFFTRTWDPDVFLHDPRERRARRDLNEMRAGCIRVLRESLGARFIGGLAATGHALKTYPDCVAESRGITRKKRYLQLMKSSDVAVATTGLRGSNGWKLGEYIAASRAVVCERPQHEAAGGFAAGTHYLAFENPAECLAAVEGVLADDLLRRRLMEASREYYRRSLRPDVLVWNSLERALQDGAVQPELR